MGFRKTVGRKAGQMGNALLNVGRRIDDSTQGFMRNKVLGLPTDGTASKNSAKHFLGQTMFASRPDYLGDNTQYRAFDDREDLVGLGASRALQGGMVTAAGYGLSKLTEAFTQYGGEADQQAESQIEVDKSGNNYLTESLGAGALLTAGMIVGNDYDEGYRAANMDRDIDEIGKSADRHHANAEEYLRRNRRPK